ncbi:MAG: acyltransferase domain-containing protein, partial [Clostridiales bacterium]|nr:acyltransferase domain-containing protein [Clostridiales bacterium]
RTETAGLWKEKRRLAGVSGFGFGGTNFHTIVENYEAGVPAVPLRVWPSELFVFRGDTPEDGKALMEKVQALYGLNNRIDIKDVAYSLACRETEKPAQFVIVASNKDELLSRIETALEGAAAENVFPLANLPGKLAFLFSGQGSQRVNMAADLFVIFPQMRRLLLKYPEYEKILFPNAVFTNEQKKAQRAAITDTRNAQPLLGLVDLAIAELLRGFGLEPDVVAGHSYGELPALCFAGAFPAEDLVSLSRARAEAILGAVGEDPGRMVAVRADADTVARLVKGETSVWAVNYNSPKQTVVAGTSAGIEAFLEKLKKEAVACEELNVACAFHSPLLKGADKCFSDALSHVPFHKAGLPVSSNTDAGYYPATGPSVKKRLAEHLVNPVRFTEEIQRLYEDGVRIFIETGPGGTLTGLAGAILKDRDATLIQTERRGAEGLTYLLCALAKVLAAGKTFRVQKLFEGRDVQLLDLDHPESHKKTGLIWTIDGMRALPENGPLPAHAGKITDGPIKLAGDQQGRFSGTDADIMMTYLENMNTVIQNQRDVLVSYWGDSDWIETQTPQMLPLPADEPPAAEDGPTIKTGEEPT